MPELPEVETLCRQLKKKITGSRMENTDVYDEKLAGAGKINNVSVVGVERRGKTIVIHLEDDRSISIHLRMTGRLLWQDSPEKPKHGRWRIKFPEGNIFLVDPRRFATIKLEKTRKDKMMDDLLAGFNQKVFMEKQAVRRVNIKVLLMDPKAVAGIGNIYASEILYGAGINPLRTANTLTIREWEKILSEAKKILKAAIKKRGTSISDWRDLYGHKGENQNVLRVYGREGKVCSVCSKMIMRIKQGGRSTFYCHRCQK